VRLDDKGRCCGRKPLVYKTSWRTGEGPHKFCTRCDRAYDLETGEQLKNWAWYQDGSGVWQPTYGGLRDGRGIE
jgi:hypothetical protein